MSDDSPGLQNWYVTAACLLVVLVVLFAPSGGINWRHQCECPPNELPASVLVQTIDGGFKEFKLDACPCKGRGGCKACQGD